VPLALLLSKDKKSEVGYYLLESYTRSIRRSRHLVLSGYWWRWMAVYIWSIERRRANGETDL